jgi:hypothetical protein
VAESKRSPSSKDPPTTSGKRLRRSPAPKPTKDDAKPPSALRGFALTAAERVRSLAEQADGVIAEIRHDAEASARSEEAEDGADAAERARLLRELGDALADYAAGVRQQCEDVLGVLDRVSAQLQPGGETASPEADEKSETAARPEGRPPGEAREGDRASEGLRLLAIQMAGAGTPRPEIAGRLRDEFGYANADKLLDEIFAP